MSVTILDASGRVERRGVVTGVSVATADGSGFESVGAYDAGGGLVREDLPGGVVRRVSVDVTGELVAMSYSGPLTDPETGVVEADRPWLAWSGRSNAAGQVTDEWTPDGAGESGAGSDVEYGYDRAGRLTRVADRSGDAGSSGAAVGCRTRSYGFDRNGNRILQAADGPGTGGECQTGSSGAGVSRVFDAADRPVTGGNGQGSYAYDALGRQTLVPAADAPQPGQGGLRLGYYDTDEIASIGQGSGDTASTTTFSLDGSGRRLGQRRVDASGTDTLVRHYTDASDNPTWSVATAPDGQTTTTRYVETIAGDLSVTLTARGAGPAQASLQLASPRGDIAASVAVADTAGGIDAFTSFTEYGLPATDTGQATAGAGEATGSAGGVAGIGYGRLGAKQRATLDTGLTLMGARLYNPTTGAFTNLDPVDGGGDTTYGYPTDPINHTDTDGNKWHRKVGRSSWKKIENRADCCVI